MLPIHQLSLSLYSSSRFLIQLIQNSLNELNLTYPQFLVLSVLWEEDGLKVNEIGNRLYLDSGTLTPLLKKLEAMNYVKRQRGEADERTVHVELTYPGKSLQAKVQETIISLNEKFLKSSDLNLPALNHSLTNLLGSIETLKKAT
ncbi:DNA-binding MarR family transcriptional regulator [Algoriphagus ratkowskyi]|uniref:MarR family transcriptional regulator n=1 Tax=Algoriphagus ratkowskyi TaxID=57028 RepID=A0A2W7RMC8_9BACT|nr:MarR family transcriptional regulator [Algoriphagus ratkowskyi]PZX59640.1 DNA-binding MarR family transcriptional regulator [Algoriphagus ratkowskyi]TXD78638.1 MarR family transcriptional regulator [Algoriphagus ratkowskyi]